MQAVCIKLLWYSLSEHLRLIWDTKPYLMQLAETITDHVDDFCCKIQTVPSQGVWTAFKSQIYFRFLCFNKASMALSLLFFGELINLWIKYSGIIIRNPKVLLSKLYIITPSNKPITKAFSSENDFNFFASLSRSSSESWEISWFDIGFVYLLTGSKTESWECEEYESKPHILIVMLTFNPGKLFNYDNAVWIKKRGNWKWLRIISFLLPDNRV